ncbi:MAG: hypothetical protein WBK46_04910 [Ruminococcus flavefaciens]
MSEYFFLVGDDYESSNKEYVIAVSRTLLPKAQSTSQAKDTLSDN